MMLTGWSLHLENMEIHGIEETPRKSGKAGEKEKNLINLWNFMNSVVKNIV